MPFRREHHNQLDNVSMREPEKSAQEQRVFTLSIILTLRLLLVIRHNNGEVVEEIVETHPVTDKVISSAKPSVRKYV